MNKIADLNTGNVLSTTSFNYIYSFESCYNDINFNSYVTFYCEYLNEIDFYYCEKI